MFMIGAVPKERVVERIVGEIERETSRPPNSTTRMHGATQNLSNTMASPSVARLRSRSGCRTSNMSASSS